jgi:hypothetical protein
MVRIIPWNLPPVAGGSEGGYTPQPTPEPPEPEVYIDIENIYIRYSAENNMSCKVDGSDKKKLTAFNGSNIIRNVVAVNLVGVSSISVVASVKYGATNTGTVTVSVDPQNLQSMTFTSGTMTQNLTGVTVADLTITQYDLYVYNGNGEIMQTATVEVTP